MSGWPVTILIACVLGAVCPGRAAAADPPPVPFPVGERLTYSITWFGIAAGTATLEVRDLASVNGRPAYRIMTRARSTPFISTFYKVDDWTESLWDAQSFSSIRFTKHLREGRYRHDSEISFDLEAAEAVFRYIDHKAVSSEADGLEDGARKGGLRTEKYPAPPGVQDELSQLYLFRTRPLQLGRSETVQTFASKKTWEVEVQVLKKERVKTPAGKFDTILVKPLLKFEGIFQRKGEMLIWLTDDAARIPVKMTSKVVIGSFVTTLLTREVIPSENTP